MTTSPPPVGPDLDDDRMSTGTKIGIATVIGLAVGAAVLLVIGSLAPAAIVASDTTTTSAPSEHEAGAVTVDVRAGEYYFKTAVTTFKVGVKYHFVVRNVGALPHEFMLVQPIAAGMMSMDEMDQMAVGHIEDADLQSAQTSTIDVTFSKPYAAGTLEMACHVGQHYEKGMRLPITVSS